MLMFQPGTGTGIYIYYVCEPFMRASWYCVHKPTTSHCTLFPLGRARLGRGSFLPRHGTAFRQLENGFGQKLCGSDFGLSCGLMVPGSNEGSNICVTTVNCNMRFWFCNLFGFFESHTYNLVTLCLLYPTFKDSIRILISNSNLQLFVSRCVGHWSRNLNTNHQILIGLGFQHW